MLAGTDEGLFEIRRSGRTAPVWTGGSVKKIIHTTVGGEQWIILGSEGILVSTDLLKWEQRNGGLPDKKIKIFQNREKTFLTVIQEIKDLEINPTDPNIMVCSTKDRVYLSRDQGRSWTNLGAPPYRTNGIKAVAAAYMPRTGGGANSGGELTVFLSHSTYGIHYMHPNQAGSKWTELNGGIEALETTGNADELADIAVRLVPPPNEEGNPAAEIWVSQTFRRRVYRLNWERKSFSLVWSDNSPFGTVDSLYAGANSLTFIYEGTAAALDLSNQNFPMQKRRDIYDSIRKINVQGRLNCAVIKGSAIGDAAGNGATGGANENADMLTLSELWLLDEPEPAAVITNPQSANTKFPSPYTIEAANKEGLYMQVNHAMENNRLKPLLDVMNRGGLNMIVIDMKDDYGRLRFTPNNPAISAKGRVFRPLDIDAFLKDMKQRNIFTVARIVVFKDPELAAKENNRFAVWDGRNSKPWVGYYDVRRKKSDISEADRKNHLMRFFATDDPEVEIVRNFYDEHWVDPYSEEVWEYTAALAQELHERGFDEIQFDYIRFPTDGVNLGDAR